MPISETVFSPKKKTYYDDHEQLILFAKYVKNLVYQNSLCYSKNEMKILSATLERFSKHEMIKSAKKLKRKKHFFY